ncbi:MAG: hypothetical protein U0936_11125 [Planctomycetaceae bacterium]
MATKIGIRATEVVIISVAVKARFEQNGSSPFSTITHTCSCGEHLPKAQSLKKKKKLNHFSALFHDRNDARRQQVRENHSKNVSV